MSFWQDYRDLLGTAEEVFKREGLEAESASERDKRVFKFACYTVAYENSNMVAGRVWKVFHTFRADQTFKPKKNVIMFRTRSNYKVISDEKEYPFHFKSDAIASAVGIVNSGTNAYVLSTRTDQITYILHRSRTSCRVCGNELEGKKHCALCGALHHYA